MKKYILLTAISLGCLFLTGCSLPGGATSTDSTSTPYTLGIPQLEPKEPLNWGVPLSIGWTENENQLVVQTGDKVLIYSNEDWSVIHTNPNMGFSTTVPISYQNGRLIGFYDGEKPSFREYDSSTKQFTHVYPVTKGLSIIEASYTGMTFIGADYSCVSSTVRDCPITFTINPIIGSASGIQFYEQPYNENFKLPGFYFSADGRYLVGNTPDNQIQVWNTQTGKRIFSTPVDSKVFGVDFSADDQLVVTAGNDATARVYDLSLGKEINRISHLTDPVYFAKFVADGQEILICTNDKKLSRWSFDREANQISKIADLTFQEETSENWEFLYIPLIVISPDEHQIAVQTQFSVRIWDVSDSPRKSACPDITRVH